MPVSTLEELETALGNPHITNITLINDITGDISADRLINLDFSDHVLTGDVQFDILNTGHMNLEGTASPSITGDLTVNASHASVANDVQVGGSVIIKDIAGNTWHENADGNDLIIDILEEGTSSVIIGGNVNTLLVSGSGDGLSIQVAGSVETAIFDAPAEVTGSGNISTIHINSKDVKLDEDQADIVTPDPEEGGEKPVPLF